MPVRVAVVGLGWAGREIWLPRLVEHPGYELVAVADASPAAREAAATAWPDVRALADAKEMTPQLVDLAVVAVPNHLHTTVACGLLRRGVAVFLEKPVCLTSDEAARLAAAEREADAVLLAGSAARYRADVMLLREVVSREAGEIRHVEVSWVRAKGVPDAGGWFTRGALSGGGALVDLGWHLLDTVMPLLGPVDYEHVLGTVSGDFVQAAAHGASWRHGRGSVLAGDVDVEDTARGFVVTSSGVSVALRASWASHEAFDTTTIRVEGRAGMVSLRCTFGFSPNRSGDPELLLTRAGESMVIPVHTEPVGAEYNRQLDVLPRMLADTGSRGRAVAEARRTIGVIERLYGSARRDRRVPAEAATG
jgi:oxidoreductase